MGKDFSGSYDKLSGPNQEIVQVLVAAYHFRNGTKNHDGSLGAIYITPMQLSDLLSYCILEGHHPHSIKW